MWAASDDYWDEHFVETLVNALESDPELVTAFTPYALVDETGQIFASRFINYSGFNSIIRISKLSWFNDDGCVYGLYNRERIKDIRFPIWWGVNRRSRRYGTSTKTR